MNKFVVYSAAIFAFGFAQPQSDTIEPMPEYCNCNPFPSNANNCEWVADGGNFLRIDVPEDSETKMSFDIVVLTSLA